MRYVIAPIQGLSPDKKKPNYAVLKEGKEPNWGLWVSPRIYLVDDPKQDITKLDDAWFKSKKRIVSKLSLSRDLLSLSVPLSRDATCIEFTYTIGETKGKELVVTLEKRFLDKHGKPVTKRSSMQGVWALPLVVILAILANRILAQIRKRRLQSRPDPESIAGA